MWFVNKILNGYHPDQSEKPYLINFRVTDLKALLDELKKKGVTIVDDIQEYDFGRFSSILDPEGNKIELWEPADQSASK